MTSSTTITLRPFTKDDTTFFAALASDDRVTRFVGDGQPWGSDMIAARVRIALDETPADTVGAVRWFLAVDEYEPVGLLVSTRREPGVEIGYWVSPEHWGRGVAGAIVEQALALVPEVFDSERLTAKVDPENAASTRVLTRRGFHFAFTDANLDQYVRDPKDDRP